mmetsp:Transcript_93854/g.251142  ORF Transcript_93854/g.251142 Transcript_93854/m.251142 type:complete len:295 (+) Transcript_93854:308-1192(+)
MTVAFLTGSRSWSHVGRQQLPRSRGRPSRRPVSQLQPLREALNARKLLRLCSVRGALLTRTRQVTLALLLISRALTFRLDVLLDQRRTIRFADGRSPEGQNQIGNKTPMRPRLRDLSSTMRLQATALGRQGAQRGTAHTAIAQCLVGQLAGNHYDGEDPDPAAQDCRDHRRISPVRRTVQGPLLAGRTGRREARHSMGLLLHSRPVPARIADPARRRSSQRAAGSHSMAARQPKALQCGGQARACLLQVSNPDNVLAASCNNLENRARGHHPRRRNRYLHFYHRMPAMVGVVRV